MRELQRARIKTAADIAAAVAAPGSAGQIVTENAIKLFINKKSEERINKNNKVLPSIYSYIRANLQAFPEDLKAFAVSTFHVADCQVLTDDDISYLETIRCKRVSESMLDWMAVSQPGITKLCERLSGEFFLFRRSAEDPDTVLKSAINFDPSDSRRILNVKHTLVMRSGEEKLASGVVVPATENIYCILEADNKQSIEMIVFHEAGGFGKINRAMGLITTTQLKRVPVSAKMAIVRAAPAWSEIGNRVSLKEPSGRSGGLIQEILFILGNNEAIVAPI